MPRDPIAVDVAAQSRVEVADTPQDATAPSGGLSHLDFVWLIGSVCRLSEIPFDAGILLARASVPFDEVAVVEALRAYGFEVDACTPGDAAGNTTRNADDLHIGLLRSQTERDAALTPVLIAGFRDAQVAFFMPRSPAPIEMPRADFEQRLAAPLRRAHRAVGEPTDPDAVRERQKFGFRWFVPELLKHRGIWRNVLLASLAIQVLALGTPLITQTIIDKVVVHRTESTLIALGIGLAVFVLFSSALTWVRQFLVLHTGMRIDAVLGASVFRHLVELPPRYFEQRPTGVIAARLHGVESIRDFLASAAVALILDLPFLSICLVLMFWYSATLSLVALACLGGIVAASLAVSPVFQSRLNREFLLGARNQAFVTEYVAGIDTVKSLQLEPTLQRRYGDYLSTYLKAGFATRQAANTYGVIAQTLEQAMTVSILIVGAWIVMSSSRETGAVFTIGMLVAFQMFAGKLSQPLLRLVGLWQQFQQARLAVVRLGDLMDAPAEPYSIQPRRARKIEGGQPVIRIDRLAFRHTEDRPLLYEDFSLSVAAGECVAIVGPSGCGKSTLARLLQGFYLPTQGSVLIDGIDTRNLAANELRSYFGVVPQETVLFSGAVLENLQLANARAGFEEIVTACRMAEIHDDIERLPQGYATPIGERGVGLSGGQRQRIAIARALLKRPRVLIFDEATSNLDARTAETFARTINALRGKVTILFITHHRPASLRFDRVIDLATLAPAPAAQVVGAVNGGGAK